MRSVLAASVLLACACGGHSHAEGASSPREDRPAPAPVEPVQPVEPLRPVEPAPPSEPVAPVAPGDPAAPFAPAPPYAPAPPGHTSPYAPPPPGMPPPAIPPSRVGAIWPPPGYEPPPCELELSTVARRRGSSVEVVARVRNRTQRTITLALPDRCPDGPVQFTGLPAGYDYYGTCAMGACAGPRNPAKFRIEPGGEIEVGSTTIHPEGGSCNAALPPGRYSIGFAVPQSSTTCAGRFASIEGSRPPPKPAPRTTPAKPCPPMPVCGIGCPFGLARDENGCPLCACADGPSIGPGTPGTVR